MTAAPKGTRLLGHALRMEWSGEHGADSSSTGTCKCGAWEESASNQNEVRFEYRCHLGMVLREALVGRPSSITYDRPPGNVYITQPDKVDG